RRWNPRREVDDVVIEKRHPRFDRVGHRQLVHAHQQMLGKAQLHLHVRDLLEKRWLVEPAVEPPEVLANDGVAVEHAMTVRYQSFNRTVDRVAERRRVGCKPPPALTPPADRSSPEQLLAARGAVLHLERLARDRSARLPHRRTDAPPPGELP